MRIRSVKPDFWRDRDTTGRWPADLKLLYVGLWGVADDEGRLELDLDLLAADLDPFRCTWPDLGGAIERLRATGRLVVYEAAGAKYGFLPKFTKHQHPNKPTPSRLPAPPVGLPESSRSRTEPLPPVEEGRVEGGGEGEEPACSPRAREGERVAGDDGDSTASAADRMAAAMSAPTTPGYVPPGFRKPTPPDPDAPDDDFPPAKKLVVEDRVELPPVPAAVRAELERRRGALLALAGRDEFAAQVTRLEAVHEGESLRVCLEAWDEFQRRTGGESPGSLRWFAEAMAKYLGEPLGPSAPSPLPAPDPVWLASLPEDLRAKAKRQWEVAETRLRRAAWGDRLPDLLEQERAGLVARIDAMRMPPAAAGGAP